MRPIAASQSFLRFPLSHILGTEAQPVRFASDHPDPTRNDWDSVLLEDTRDARIENATFEYARIALDVRNSTVRMVHVRLLESAFAGLQVDRGLPTSQSVVVVEDSLLSANATTGEFGILNEQNGAVIWRGTARFRRCEFAENLVGLMTLEGATVEVEDSLFANNWVGLFAVGAQVTMRRSEVRHNGLPGFGGVGITLLGGSLGRVEDSRLENNGFGLDIDYSSRASVRLSRNVTVNGIPLEEIYYVGRADELMRGARMDSGRTGGFVGNVSFQGGLTLYDSRNLTFEDLSLEYNLQNLWAENSTFTLVNSTLRDATVNIALREGGDVLLKQFSVGYFVNTIFNLICLLPSLAIGVRDTVAELIVREGGRKAGLVDLRAETRQALLSALADAREAGFGIPQTARLIREYVPAGRFTTAGAAYRAKLIARTETRWATNVSVAQIGAAAGFERWRAFDNRTGFGDEECVARDGQEFTEDEMMAEMDAEHPNGTLSFAPVPRT